MKDSHLSFAAVLGLALACCAPALAQFELPGPAEESELPELRTDRDAFTPAVTTAGRGLSILEASYSFIDNRVVAETHSFPELLFRHGISECIELRIGWNYEVGGTGGIVSGFEDGVVFDGELERASQILYGAKLALTTQQDWLPQSAFILQGYTPTSGEVPETDVVLAYVFGWELMNEWRLDASIRYGTEHSEEDAFSQWAPSVVLRVPLDEQWHAHIEYFGIFWDTGETSISKSYVSPGMHYLLTPDLELGVRVGWGISPDSPNFFSNVGIGWRF